MVLKYGGEETDKAGQWCPKKGSQMKQNILKGKDNLWPMVAVKKSLSFVCLFDCFRKTIANSKMDSFFFHTE